MSNISKAVKTWLEYEDSDRFDEDKARELMKARIEVREALRKGYRLVDLKTLFEKLETYEADINLQFSETAPECLECNRVCFASIKKMIEEYCE
ncbi:MAG: hypothetical protein IKE85_06070 [Mogibacterium sp.]|nr:hypothetical protein [Mogibacterium sp.]